MKVFLTLISFLDVFNTYIGRDVKTPFLVRVKFWLKNRYSDWATQASTDEEVYYRGIKYFIIAYFVFLELLAWLISEILSKENSLYTVIFTELSLVFYIFYFGFKTIAKFKLRFSELSKKLSKIFLVVIAIFNAVLVLLIYVTGPLLGKPANFDLLLKHNLTMLLALALVAAFLLVVFELIPFLISHLITSVVRRFVKKSLTQDDSLGTMYSYLLFPSVVITVMQIILVFLL